ncbi:hypothetical protein JJD41_06260 [Oxynema sp. CENA135]|uniref:hypothetical protein n=1 Tax=Oxynema sp. CENA135 TaxID=984206 RepID=UPI00190E34B2|nr:hypothetical protein [Oxynema sp. CENA135]MBK4729468.1 hypothetical protein [Oxynema sp. CENA135]
MKPIHACSMTLLSAICLTPAIDLALPVAGSSHLLAKTTMKQENAERVTLTGVVIRKEWSQSAESWMAGGSEYYVLDVGDAEIEERTAAEGTILRGSDEVEWESFEDFVGMEVVVEGEFVAPQPYVPSSPMENYPTGMDGKPLPRGGGFKVYSIAPVGD